MKILHTEASKGWGGQEIRILKEAVGMRERGHELFFALNENAQLAGPLKENGFVVYEIPFRIKAFPKNFIQLFKIIKKHKIEVINTHSSFDSWLGGFVGRLAGCLIIRTRHLSTSIKKGVNSLLLYNWLCDGVVTTCQKVVPIICKQAKISSDRCLSIPTGIIASELNPSTEKKEYFKKKLGIQENQIVIGTLCILRSWKGVSDFLLAARLLKEHGNLRWLIVGGGVSEHYFKEECKALGLENHVIFTGYQENPVDYLSLMDIFVLLSRANEGVSQASLQAAFLKKPLITTSVGGLSEVCIPQITGLQVDVQSPEQVSNAIIKLAKEPNLRLAMGEAAYQLVMEKFTMSQMLDKTESFYHYLKKCEK